MTTADTRDVPGSSGAREGGDVVYVDHDPLIPTHLGTDAPHVHVRTTDRCLRQPEGVECLSPAELRAEVERLRAFQFDMLSTSAVARAEAERDALQQRLDNVRARVMHAPWWTIDRVDLVPVAEVSAALGGPAAPPQEPQPTPEADEACAHCDGSGMFDSDDREDAPCPECHPSRQSVPVERITDAHGDETERGADTDTENTHQQDGDHR